jgi:D-alanine-D-alanine ligase-like ATP-grasp enzyme
MPKTTKIKYEVIETNEVPELSRIKKSNITTEITLADTLAGFKANSDLKERITNEKRLKVALLENVTTNHPEVLTIDPETRIACHLYEEANKYLSSYDAKMEEIDTAQRELQEEIDEIAKQTGISKMTEEKKNEILAAIQEKIDNGEVL